MTAATAPEIDVAVVLFDSAAHVDALLAALAAQTYGAGKLHLIVADNASSDDGAARAERLAHAVGLRITVLRNPCNLGFGAAVNRAARHGQAPLLFVLNPDAQPAPGCVSELVRVADGDPAIGIVEARQQPIEHPKLYDPVTLETTWCSAAACLVRRAAFEAVGGFDPALFLYCEDVDLSWRMRAAGHRCVYAPRAVVAHGARDADADDKPLQALYGVTHNLFLRWRYGSLRDIGSGYLRWAWLLARTARAPERRARVLRAFRLHLPLLPAAVAGRRRLRAAHVATFAGWDYAAVRPGCTTPIAAAEPSCPLVSVVVRTRDRPAFLREALTSLANQTYRNLQVVVVDDCSDTGRRVSEEFAARLAVTYVAGGAPGGRARAGNLGVAQARGEWLLFLDDDDVLFADHVESLVNAAGGTGRVVFSMAFAARQRVHAVDPLVYEIVDRTVVHDHDYDRLLLFHHNYLPIQSVLFRRALFAAAGGLDESLEALEDWDLWIRLALAGETFVWVPRTTSEYRIRDVDPADRDAARRRQAGLDAAYDRVVRKHASAPVPLTFGDLQRMAARLHHGELLGRAAHLARSGRLVQALRLLWGRRG